MNDPAAYLVVALGSGLVLGLATGMFKASTAFVCAAAAVMFLIARPMSPMTWGFVFDVVFVYGGAGALGAWVGVELRGLASWRLRAGAGANAHPTSGKAQGGEFREAICCPYCGARSIDWWDKLMSGLTRRPCICDNCGKSSREERKTRLMTSAVFLGSLWLIGRIPHPGYAGAALAVWAILLVAVEWHYIHAIPLVPAIESASRKRLKKIFAWGFIALILATFVLAAVFDSL